MANETQINPDVNKNQDTVIDVAVANGNKSADAIPINPYFAQNPIQNPTQFAQGVVNNPYLNGAAVQQNGVLATLANQKADIFKGALIGAVATFILTNQNTQTAIFKGIAKLSSLLEMGVEELKERYEDAKAEVNEN